MAKDDVGVSVAYSMADDDEPMLTVTEAVARFKEVDVTALRPLNDAVDVDALRRIFHKRDGEDQPGLTVAFDYEGCEVTVEPREVHVAPVE